MPSKSTKSSPAQAEPTNTKPTPIKATAPSKPEVQMDPVQNSDEQLRRAIEGEMHAAAAERLKEAFESWLRYDSSPTDIAFLQGVFEIVNSSLSEGECGLITAALIQIPDELLAAVGTGKLPNPRPEWSTRNAWLARFPEKDGGKAA